MVLTFLLIGNIVVMYLVLEVPVVMTGECEHCLVVSKGWDD